MATRFCKVQFLEPLYLHVFLMVLLYTFLYMCMYLGLYFLFCGGEIKQ